MGYLKSSNSVNDHLNDNGFNKKAELVYIDEKMVWDEGVCYISPTHMSTVKVKMWAHLSCETGYLIKQSFEKLTLHLYAHHNMPIKSPQMLVLPLSKVGQVRNQRSSLFFAKICNGSTSPQ